MFTIQRLGLGLLAAAIGGGAVAHDLKYLEDQIKSREPYFQAIEKATPQFILRDAPGKRVGLDDFLGKVVVLHFIYASCRDVCPLHSELLAQVQALINRTPMKETVQFVSVTTDPDRDTPDVMSAYGQLHGFDPANWVFLTRGADQPESATRELAQAFGHRFVKSNDGEQIHGVVTHVIDREGKWRANFHGLNFEPTNLVLYVNALVNDVHPPEPAKSPSLWDRLRALF